MTAGTITPVTTPRLGDPPVPETLLEGLNPDQAAAVQAIHGPVLVVAGPGSGKTRVLVNRIAAITTTRSAPPERILAVTFTNKAAGEMRERLSSLIPDGGSDRMWVSTFHSLCARILRMEHEAAELPRAYTIVDADDAASIIRTVLTKQELPDTLKDAREYGKLISRVKNGGNPPFDQYLASVYAEYQNTLARLGCVDFDDLLLITARILRERSDVRNRWARRFSYILIDEYQDTNPVQYELVRLLAEEHRNLCCVGDADQAIYGFRSASPAALVSFQQDWPDSRIVYLGENYRCSGNILAAAQAVIEHTPSPLRPQLRTANPPGDPVRLVVCGDDRAEAGLIARECREIRRSNSQESVAVLTRTRAMTRSLEEAMLAAGVPYTIVGALRFYDRAEVKDALSWVRFLVNPNDELALRRLVTSPRRGLGDGALQDLVDYAAASGLTLRQAISTAEASVLPARSRAKWAELGKVLDQLEAIGRSTNPATLLQGILDAGVRAHTLATGGDTAEDRVENLDELLTGAAAFLAQPNPTDPEQVPVAQLSPWEQVEAFLIHVALLTSAEEGDTAHGPVPILTAHASKGKEFDRVYVCGLEEGLFPHSRSTTTSALEEERRLLFVACSRARRHLTLTRAERRMTFREVVSNRPSSFLADLPDTVVVEHEHSTYERPRSAAAPTWGGRTSPKRKQVMLPGPRLEPGQAHAGMQVQHGSFGTGTITGINTDDDTLTIAFADGVKILKRAMAPLRPV